MKTICLQVEDHLYAVLIALIQQLPSDKVQIVSNPQSLLNDGNKVKVSDLMQFSDTINWPVDGLEYQYQTRNNME